MNSEQGGEIFGKTAVREECTMEGAVEVVSETPMAASDGGPGVPVPVDDAMAASPNPSPLVEPSKPRSKLFIGACVDYFCECNTTRFRWYELEGKGCCCVLLLLLLYLVVGVILLPFAVICCCILTDRNGLKT